MVASAALAQGRSMSTVVVAGASGGLGTSTAAAHLCWRAAPTMGCLVDSTYGSIDVTTGLDHVVGPRWDAFCRLEGPANGAAILSALPSTSRYAVLAGGVQTPPPDVVTTVVESLAEHADLLVVDAGSVDVLDQSWLTTADALVLLAGVGVRHLADVDRVTERLAEAALPVHLVTRGPRRRASLGEQVAWHTGFPLLGHWADDPAVARDLERGVPPGRHTHGFDPMADRLLTTLASGTLGRTA